MRIEGTCLADPQANPFEKPPPMFHALSLSKPACTTKTPGRF